MLGRELLLDVSRLVWRGWSQRISTGIDRVCHAYLEHFGNRAQAVVQYRGVARILSPRHSDELFNFLLKPDETFRHKIAALAPRALLRGESTVDGNDAFYLNVGHTDIDIDRTIKWVERSGLRAIYMLHDLIPLTHSEFCREEAILRHRGRVFNALRTAAGIIANSSATKSSIHEFSQRNGLFPPPTISVWLAGAQLEKPAVIRLSSRPHFVCVGTIEGRKNHFMLLQIWRRLVERLGPAVPELIIIGQDGVEASHVKAMLDRCAAIQGHVRILRHCDDEKLGHWLSSARALLLPSFAEGFGLPLVEALQLGTPVIASNLPSFREIGMGIPTLIDPLNASLWEETIISYLGHCPDRSRQLRLLAGYRAPTWASHFSKVEDWLAGLRRPDKAGATRRFRPSGQAGGRPQASAAIPLGNALPDEANV